MRTVLSTSRTAALAALLYFGSLAVVGGLLSACESLGGPLANVPTEWVRADRATFDAVAPKLRAYVLADPAFVDDPIARDIWISALEDWEARIAAHEETIEGGGER